MYFIKLLKKILPIKLVKFLAEVNGSIFDGYSTKSYSQEGEDLILNRIFEKKGVGFYIDVGAHHPKRFSNTYLFYKKGWSGLNVDAMPNSMARFDRIRPRDINIEKPISSRKEILKYYIFNEPALNGFSKELSEKRNSKKDYYIKSTKDIETVTLEELLDEHLPNGQNIDFLSIDVEGLDFEVLKSNNFDKYQPEIILVEILGSNLADLEINEITLYLKNLDYFVYAKAVNTVIFLKK